MAIEAPTAATSANGPAVNEKINQLRELFGGNLAAADDVGTVHDMRFVFLAIGSVSWSPAGAGATNTSRRPSGTYRASCGSRPPSCTASRGSSTSTTCSSCPARAWAAPRTSMPTRCTSRRGSSSTRRSGRNVTTGTVISGPASQPLNVYEVQVIDGSIRVRA